MGVSTASRIHLAMDRTTDNRELAKRRVSVDRQVTAVRLGLLEDLLVTIRPCSITSQLRLSISALDGDGMYHGRATEISPTDVRDFAEALLELVEQ